MVEDGFTAGQLEAITAADGPLGIIAGPGCGKTTVLAGRIAFLIRERGFDPSTILAVSFTTEAARALRAQLGQQVGAAAADVAIHTLHALGRRVIDTWAGRLGFDERPSVLHRDEGRALLSATAADLGWDTATFSVAELSAAVDRCRLLPVEEARRKDPVWPLAQAYEERLLRHGAIDFVAMLTLPLRLFREYPEAAPRRRHTRRFQEHVARRFHFPRLRSRRQICKALGRVDRWDRRCVLGSSDAGRQVQFPACLSPAPDNGRPHLCGQPG